MSTTSTLHPAFQHNRYLFRRKVLRLFGGAFHVYDEAGNLLFYSEQKAFKLREDFRIYADEQKSQELLTIKTPQILDLGATYYVRDATTGEVVGALRRKALKSILKDEWLFLSPDEQEVGRLMEKSTAGALLSRFINLIPQDYVAVAGDGRTVATIRQHFNPFVLKYTMTILEPEPPIDRRLLVAAGILLAGIERRQQ
ncbi:MAG TPA: hypothetical protein ENK56_02335 [Chloroflexi bacterium]|nr:hypothetical protein [Chloroflexota bacterium]